MPVSRKRATRGSAESRRRHRRAVEAVGALKAANQFERAIHHLHHLEESLVCTQCGGSVRKAQDPKGVKILRCSRCGRSATPEELKALRAAVEGPQVVAPMVPPAAQAKPEEPLIILTDDLPAAGRESGLYIPRHLAMEIAQGQK